MKCSPRRAASALLPLALATPVAAQTRPMPALPPEAVEAAPDLGVPARPRDWEYALGLGAGWDSNIDFQVPGGPSGASLLPRGGLARIFSGPHGRLRALAAGGWTGYPDLRPLSRHYGEVGLDAHYQLSPTTYWHANVSRGFGQSDSTRVLLEQGVSLPLVDTRSVAAGLGLRKTGPRRSFRLEGRYYGTTFDSPVLIDGQSLRGTAAFERPLSSRTTATLEYAVERVRSDQGGRSYLTHFASVQWTRLVAPRGALLLEAGASYTPDAARAGLDQEESFFGGASFSRLVRRSSLMVFVRREVTPAFGIGVSRLALRAGVGATVPLFRTVELRVTGTHVQPETPDTVAQVYGPSDDVYAVLGRRLGRRLEVSAEARYRRRAASAAFPALESIQAGVFVTVASPAGRSLAPAPGR